MSLIKGSKEVLKQAAEKAMNSGVQVLTSGLAVPEGKYEFAVAATGDVYGAREVERKADSQKFLITFIAGSLKGLEDGNKGINQSFELEGNNNFVVTYDQALNMNAGETYIVDIATSPRGTKRVSSVMPKVAIEGTLVTAP